MEQKVRKYRSLMDWVMDDMAVGFEYLSPLKTSYSLGTWVDPEKYDIVPKKQYYEELINKAQERIDALDRQHESDEKYYKSKREELKQEKERLLRERDNKNKSG